MNPTATNGDDETLVPKEKVKSCLGLLILMTGQRFPKVLSTGMSPLCVGIPFSREEVSPSRFHDGPKLEWVWYDCVGFSTYLKQSGKEPLSDKQTTWKQPYCAGFWRYNGDAPRTADRPGYFVVFGAGSSGRRVVIPPAKEGDQEVPK